MDSALLEQLSPLARLALSYAPGAVRDDWLTLLALDAKLAGIVRQAREETLARIRLAWWRERLQAPVAERPKGEPLLARLADWPDAGRGLEALVDGWEALLGDEVLSAETLSEFADGRAAAANLLLARHSIAPRADLGGWGLADLALNLSDPAEKAVALDLLRASPGQGKRPKALRPLVVIEGVTRKAALAGRPLLSGPIDLLLAMRLGLLGA